MKAKYDIRLDILEKMLLIFKRKQHSFPHCYSSAHIISALFLKGILNIEELTIDKLIDLINVLAVYIKNLEGIPISVYLSHYMKQIVNFILESEEYKKKIDEDQTKKLKEFQEDKSLQQLTVIDNKDYDKKFEEIEKMCEDESIDQKNDGLNKLFDIFSECSNYEEQIQLFAGKGTEIFKKLLQNLSINDETKKEKVKGILIILGKLMETLMVNTEFLIEVQRDKLKKMRTDNPAGKQLEQLIVNKEDVKSFEEFEKKRSECKLEADSVILQYRMMQNELVLKRQEDIYPTVALIINSMLLFPQSLDIMTICLNTLQVMYNIFPQYRMYIEDPLLNVLQNFNEFQDEENKKKAAFMAYQMLNSENPSYRVREMFNTREKLSSLTSNKYYSKEYIKKSTFLNPLVQRFDQLLIRSPFSLQKVVQPEKGFVFNVEVKRPFSILYCGFATYQNDINVRISKVLDFEDFEDCKTLPRYYYEQKINSEMEPYRILFMVEKPGVFKIEFDNSYSWVNEKKLRFRSCILEAEEVDAEIKKTLEIEEQTEEDLKKDAQDALRRFKESLQGIKIQMIFRAYEIDFRLRMDNVEKINEKYEFDKENFIDSLKQVNTKIEKKLEDTFNPKKKKKTDKEEEEKEEEKKDKDEDEKEKEKDKEDEEDENLPKLDLSKIKCTCAFIYNREIMEIFRDFLRVKLYQRDQEFIYQIFEFFSGFWDSVVSPIDENFIKYEHHIQKIHDDYKDKKYLIVKVDFKHKLMSSISYDQGKIANTNDYSLLMAGPNMSFKKAFYQQKSQEQGEKIIYHFLTHLLKIIRKENKFEHIYIWEEEQCAYFKDDNYKKYEEMIDNIKSILKPQQFCEISYLQANIEELGYNVEDKNFSEDEDEEQRKKREKEEREEREKQQKELQEKEENELKELEQLIEQQNQEQEEEDAQ